MERGSGDGGASGCRGRGEGRMDGQSERGGREWEASDWVSVPITSQSSASERWSGCLAPVEGSVTILRHESAMWRKPAALVPFSTSSTSPTVLFKAPVPSPTSFSSRDSCFIRFQNKI